MRIQHLNLSIMLVALLAIYAQMHNAFEVFAVLKPLTTILIVTVVIIHGQREAKTFHYLIVVALIACLFGDVFLLSDDLFVFGLSSFLVGHLCFTVAFIRLGGFKMLILPLVALLLFSVSYYAYLFPALGDFKVPVAIYNLVIVSMAWQALSLALRFPRTVTYMLAGASLLFMFSDSMIALNKFKLPFEWSGVVILSTYWLSIALIANVAASDDTARLLRENPR